MYFSGLPLINCARSASKKAAGSTKNQGKNKKGKHLGVKRREGMKSNGYFYILTLRSVVLFHW